MQKVSPQRNWEITAFTCSARHFSRRSIQRIARHRMPQRGQMHPYLVRAPGVNLHLQQTKLAVARIQTTPHMIVRDGLTATRIPRAHARPPHPIAADAARNPPRIRLQPAMHQRHILLLHLALRKLRRQSPVRQIILGNDDEPARPPVQTVHNSRPQFSA